MNYKKDFAIINKYHYLDNASTTLKPKPVIDKITEIYTNYGVNIHRGLYDLSNKATEMYENTRIELSKLFDAKSNEIIFTKSTTESLNILANGLIKNNDKVLLSEMEHHSNIVPWQMRNANIQFVNVNNAELDYCDLENKINKFKPKIISLMHASNVLGTINNIKEIVKLAKDNNIVVGFDCAQTSGHLPINFKKLNADFITFSAHKMLGPFGLGVLIAKESILNQIDPLIGGGNMIGKVKKDGFTYAHLPDKFEGGTQNITNVIAFNESLKYLNNVGFDEINEHKNDLMKYALSKLNELNFINVVSNKKIKENVGVISFTINNVNAHDIAEILNKYNVCVRAGHHCTQILHDKLKLISSTRASFYFYNTKKDVDELINGLNNVAKVFKL